MKEILIFSELTPKSEVLPVVTELCTKAIELSKKLDNSIVSAVILNKPFDKSYITEALAQKGVQRVYFIEDEILSSYSTEPYTTAICELLKEIQPQIMLFGATRTGRDLAPRVASRLNYGLTADCTELDINEDGKLMATRPTFGGNLMATILSKSPTQMATVRPNVFQSKDNPNKIEVIKKSYPLDESKNKIELIDFKPIIDELKDNLTTAEIIIAGGRGMKGKEGFKLLKEFADLIGAKVGASRGAVDMGLADVSVQIGQTGKTVTPKIYIACGISGAIQHLVGINSADKIIAINNNPNAPIFKHSDFGIVGDVFEVLPKLIKELKK